MKKKPIPPLDKHRNHQVEIRTSDSKHYASYHCLDCNKFISWIPKNLFETAQQMGLVSDYKKNNKRPNSTL